VPRPARPVVLPPMYTERTQLRVTTVFDGPVVVSLWSAKEVFAMATQGIRSDPAIMMGKPVVEGTRITVESILEELGAGQTIEQLLDAHPRLTREGVLAAVRFGAEVLRADVAYPVTKSVA
jgi:uncharacterized protein (DUF433 family)